MNAEQNLKSAEMEKLKEIPKWARRYAESRTIPMIVRLLVVLALTAAVFFSVYCFLHKRVLLASIMMGVYVVGFVCFLLLDGFCSARYYAKSGLGESKSVKQITKYLALPLIGLCFVSVILEQRGVFPEHLRVPISASFCCTLLIFGNWRWARGSFVGYLWAGLYGAWAIAILFRVPVLTFPGRWAGMEIAVAIPLTGLVTGLIVHIYNRYALKRLKEVTHLNEAGN